MYYNARGNLYTDNSIEQYESTHNTKRLFQFQFQFATSIHIPIPINY